MLQHCVDCERAVFYPRLRCPHCWGNALTWVEASGRGTVASYTIIHRPGHPAFAADAPYVVALVDLAEGVRILSNIVNCPIETVQVEMPVNVVWEAQGEFTLPKFQPADSEEG